MEIKKHNLSFVEAFSENYEGESFIVAKDLVNNLFFDMAKLCTKYSNKIFCDLPYTYM